MPRWLWRTAPSKRKNRCLPRLSTRSRRWPSISATGSPTGRRGPGARTVTVSPASASSSRRARRRIVSPSAMTNRVAARLCFRRTLSCHQLARLAAEARLDQRGLHAGADHRFSVEPLDRELLDLAGLRSLGERAEVLDQFAVADLLQPQDALAAALDVEQRLTVPEHHVGPRGASRPSLALELRPGEGGAVGVGRVRGGEDLDRALGARERPEALDRAGQGELSPSEALDEVAAPCRAEQLEVLELSVDRGEPTRDALRDRGLSGDDSVTLQHQLGQGSHPRTGRGRTLEER